ncbi:MAG: lysophospholipid acyltransferase family protein [Kiritimatiellia bacterium]|jgi:lauroyl/myristoyl acyltransferase
MNTRPKFRHRLEYEAVRGLGASLVALPYRCALGVAWGVARIAHAIASERRREAARRVRLVFGESLRPRDVRRICWLSFRNTVFNAVEMLRIRKFTREAMVEMIPDMPAVIDSLRALKTQTDGRGLVIALPHMGNWDLAGSCCHLCGVPIFSVAGRQRNPLMNDLLNRLRAGHGMDILERGGGALRQILERIRAGQTFAILPDTRAPTPDLLVPFLGGAANLARGMASFAYATNVPVVPLIMRRRGWRHFTLTLHDPIWPDKTAPKADELERITRAVATIVDAAIHETPEQWFWYNRRWVLDPVN